MRIDVIGAKYGYALMVIAAPIVMFFGGISWMYYCTAVFGMGFVTIGLLGLFLKNKKEGRVAVPWYFHVFGASVVTYRAISLIHGEQYILAIPDIFGAVISILIQCQLTFGWFLDNRS